MKNLTDWFGRVFIINCATRPDRRERILRHLADARLADPARVTLHPAVIGTWAPPPDGWKSGPGAWGCYQSHRRLLEDILHHRTADGTPALTSALILEDDAEFTDDALPRLHAFMENVPVDWGQLYLGGQHTRPPRAYPGTAEILTGTSINRGHAYAVHHAHLPAIYRHLCQLPIRQDRPCHLDHHLEEAHRRGDWPVYCPPRWLAGQAAGYSDIDLRQNPALTWQESIPATFPPP